MRFLRGQSSQSFQKFRVRLVMTTSILLRVDFSFISSKNNLGKRRELMERTKGKYSVVRVRKPA